MQRHKKQVGLYVDVHGAVRSLIDIDDWDVDYSGVVFRRRCLARVGFHFHSCWVEVVRSASCAVEIVASFHYRCHLRKLTWQVIMFNGCHRLPPVVSRELFHLSTLTHMPIYKRWLQTHKNTHVTHPHALSHAHLQCTPLIPTHPAFDFVVDLFSHDRRDGVKGEIDATV